MHAWRYWSGRRRFGAGVALVVSVTIGVGGFWNAARLADGTEHIRTRDAAAQVPLPSEVATGAVPMPAPRMWVVPTTTPAGTVRPPEPPTAVPGTAVPGTAVPGTAVPGTAVPGRVPVPQVPTATPGTVPIRPEGTPSRRPVRTPSAAAGPVPEPAPVTPGPVLPAEPTVVTPQPEPSVAPPPTADPAPALPPEPEPGPVVLPEPVIPTIVLPMLPDEPDPAPAFRKFHSCAEAHAAGAAPLHAGEQGYARRLDDDRDGVACD